jgi:hypothetical protein
MYPIKTKTKYDSSRLAASAMTYTTVYLGNYEAGNYEEGVGSHPGVDIVPVVPNDTVVSVLDGTVHFAGTNASNGNYVVVKHENAPSPEDLSQKTTLYSVYLHLSELSTSTGAKVAEGDVIGKTGNTGQSTGEHIHFQMDRNTAPFHPYWPFTYGEAQEAGLGFFDAVNRGLGLEKAEKYTINPLPYLDAVAALPKGSSVSPGTSSVPVETVSVAASVSTPTVSTTTMVSTTTVSTTTVSNGSSTGFSDVPDSHRYAQAVKFVKDQGIAGGSDGKFRPNDTVTRGEILKMAFNGSIRVLSTDTVQHFSDVPTDHPFFAYVNTAREQKAVGGYPDGTFRPNAPVTRSEALKIVLGVLGITPEAPSFQVFTDVESSAWYAAYANWAKSSDVLTDASPKFFPDAKATRAEVAGIIYAAKTS